MESLTKVQEPVNCISVSLITVVVTAALRGKRMCMLGQHMQTPDATGTVVIGLYLLCKASRRGDNGPIEDDLSSCR